MRCLWKTQMLTVLAAMFAISSVAQVRPPSPLPPPQPVYNPTLAAHDVEVGKFYMKRGEIDGAIARFKDALRYKPNYAEPCLLLGQAYEQKHDSASAIDYYRQYLKILPNASESKKVRKRIAELQEKEKKTGDNPSQIDH